MVLPAAARKLLHVNHLARLVVVVVVVVVVVRASQPPRRETHRVLPRAPQRVRGRELLERGKAPVEKRRGRGVERPARDAPVVVHAIGNRRVAVASTSRRVESLPGRIPDAPLMRRPRGRARVVRGVHGQQKQEPLPGLRPLHRLHVAQERRRRRGAFEEFEFPEPTRPKVEHLQRRRLTREPVRPARLLRPQRVLVRPAHDPRAGRAARDELHRGAVLMIHRRRRQLRDDARVERARVVQERSAARGGVRRGDQREVRGEGDAVGERHRDEPPPARVFGFGFGFGFGFVRVVTGSHTTAFAW
eukprot:30560-Pelagococcus_subviridis.AAC.1